MLTKHPSQFIRIFGYDGYKQRYTYNAQGMRSVKEVSGDSARYTLEEIISGKGAFSEDEQEADPADEWVKTSYIYDVTMPYYEVISEETDGKLASYDYGIERISAIFKNGLYDYKTAYVYDGRGSVAQEATYNVSWAVLGSWLMPVTTHSKSYSPFGEMLEEKVSGYGFNGERYDMATGMINLRARQYEPGMMRFAQKDMAKGVLPNALSLNRYLYVENNPLNYVDPSGKFLDALWNGIKTIAEKVVSNVKTVVKKATELATKVVSKAKSIINTAKTNPAKALYDTGKAIVSGVKYIKNEIPVIKSKIASNAISLLNMANNVKDNVGNEIATQSQKGTYATPNEAAIAFGKEAQPLTDNSGIETMAAITKTTVYEYNNGKLQTKDAYKYGSVSYGAHNNVIQPTIQAALNNIFADEYYIAHTHPSCAGHQNDQFSTGFGDQAVVDTMGADGIYLVEPKSGKVYLYDGSTDINTLNNDIKNGKEQPVGSTGYQNKNYYDCKNIFNSDDLNAAQDPSTSGILYYADPSNIKLF